MISSNFAFNCKLCMHEAYCLHIHDHAHVWSSVNSLLQIDLHRFLVKILILAVIARRSL